MSSFARTREFLLGLFANEYFILFVSATSVHYSLALKILVRQVCSLLFLQGSPCACILLCRRICAACPFCCCTVISHNKLPYSPWHNEQMKTSYNDPTDSEIVVSDFACKSSALSFLMRTQFLGRKKTSKRVPTRFT